MALNIKDKETEQLAAELAALTGESKTAATRTALRERRDRLRLERGGSARPYEGMRQWLETEIWPQIPDDLKGRKQRPRADVEEIVDPED